jgi:hypothetical protein
MAPPIERVDDFAVAHEITDERKILAVARLAYRPRSPTESWQD